MSDQIQEAAPEAAPSTETPVENPTPEVETPTEPVETPPENPETPAQTDLLDISEEDLQAAIDAALASFERPDQPTSFPEDKKEEAKLDSDIEALIQQKDTELEEAKRTIQEKTTQMADIESAWGMLNQALPDLPDILTKLVSGDENALPALYRKDVNERLQSDKVLWPLIEAHIKGEQPDYPGFIRGLAAQKAKSMPKTNDAPKEPTFVETKGSTNPGMLLSQNKKTTSFI